MAASSKPNGYYWDKSFETIDLPDISIGENVLECLRELDEVAYVRFASVYRKFDSVDDFSRELHSLVKEQSKNRRQGKMRKGGGASE